MNFAIFIDFHLFAFCIVFDVEKSHMNSIKLASFDEKEDLFSIRTPKQLKKTFYSIEIF